MIAPWTTSSRPAKWLSLIVELYNDERPHNSIGNLTPNEVHKKILKLKNDGRIITGLKVNCKLILTRVRYNKTK